MSETANIARERHKQGISSLVLANIPLQKLINEIQTVYLADNRPWIIGFSGGKDSTSVLSLVYSAIHDLPQDKRHKHIYVVSSDTLVETPVVVVLINRILNLINTRSAEDGLPMSAHTVHPKMDQTFWVNLLGRGYPAPKQSFRWCTERMKIDPVSDFITAKVAEFGEVVVVLGSRRQESASRAQVIAKHRIEGSALSRHTSLPNAYTYMPIEAWSADEVWEYLMSSPCPWGGDNQALFELYKGSNQGECPLVIDKSTPSCGNSRFGCWTCTVVTEDRALHGLIESGERWMKPLLDFRNKLYASNEPENAEIYRNTKRRSGRVTFKRSRSEEGGHQEVKHIRGPYWMKHRQTWLKELLVLEKQLQHSGHPFKLIRLEELEAIRQEWLRDPNEPDIIDSLPAIYRSVYGDQIEWDENDAGAFSAPDALLLNELGEKHGVSSDLIIKLIEVELSMSGLGKRKGIMDKLTNILRQDWDTDDAIDYRNEEFSSAMAWHDKSDALQRALAAAAELQKTLD